MLLLLAAGHASAQASADVVGVVTFNAVGVPGATVIATHGDTRVVTTTDLQGAYRLKALTAGTWSVTTALVGFAPATIEITVPPSGPVAPLALTLLPLADISPRPLPVASTAPATRAADKVGTASRPTPAGAPGARAPSGPLARASGAGPVAGAPGTAPARDGGGGSQAAARATAAAAPATTGDGGDDAAAGSGFLINGSVNNGAASPFAQARAFGNNRPAAVGSTRAAWASCPATRPSTRDPTPSAGCSRPSRSTTTCR
jgi:hypothetical protein